jgi:hypothetical protein
MLSVVIRNVVVLGVLMLNVVAPVAMTNTLAYYTGALIQKCKMFLFFSTLTMFCKHLFKLVSMLE